MKSARAMSHRSSKTEVEVSKRIILMVGKTIISSFFSVWVFGGRLTSGVVEEILKVCFLLLVCLVGIDLLWLIYQMKSDREEEMDLYLWRYDRVSDVVDSLHVQRGLTCHTTLM